MIRFVPLLLFLFLAGALSLALLSQSPKEQERLLGEERSVPLSPLSVSTREGAEKTLISNGEVMVIHFFASWCAPCIEDHRELTALATTYPTLAIHGIAWNDKKEAIDAWLKQHGNPFTHVWFDTQGKAAMTLGVRGMPETFVIDAKGIVRYHVPGPMSTELRENELNPRIQTWMASS